MSPNIPELREKEEPVEGAEPVPKFVWFSIVALVVWGFAYFLLYTGSPDEIGGDMRTAPVPAVAGAAVDGAAVYGTRCAACHQADGKGIAGAFPPLAGSPWPTGDAGVPIRLVLHGLQGPIDVLGTPYQGVMPAFAAQLSDAEIAAVVTHVRGSFGNAAGPVTEAQVAEVRAATAGRKGAWTAAELKAP
ncbi:MAG: cytochrome c [Pseudomonadota bacterium]|nr:cytochrome c [Pseudomonadota bacterium]